MASRFVPVTADKVLDLWKAGVVVSDDGTTWLEWGSMADAGRTLFDVWKDDLVELMRFSPCVIVEEDTGE